jgi:hypothetical protein
MSAAAAPTPVAGAVVTLALTIAITIDVIVAA